MGRLLEVNKVSCQINEMYVDLYDRIKEDQLSMLLFVLKFWKLGN